MIFSFLKRTMFLFIICVPQFFSETLSASEIHAQNYYIEIKNIFKNDNERLGYALGVSLGKYINRSFEKQNQIGINLDKNSLLRGIKDEIFDNLKLSDKEIILILQKLEEKIKNATQIQSEKNAKENFLQGEIYMKNFSKIEGVKKTNSGLLYYIENKGEGEEVTNDKKIVVHYKGTLINGVEFDSSYKRGKPVSLRLKDVILGWQEGLKYIKKGGKIKLVIPPNLGYGEQKISDIPGNSTLIFEIELLDVVDE